MAARNAGGGAELSLLPRVSVLCAVSQVRERERAARQGGSRRAALRDARGDVGLSPREGPLYVAVVGPNDATQTELDQAEAIGEGLARKGAVLVCGGLGGVMHA